MALTHRQPSAALNPVDRLLAGYVAFTTALVVVRGVTQAPGSGWILAMHALFAALLYLFTRLKPTDRIGNLVHDLYPLAMLLPFYAEIGLLNAQIPSDTVFANDSTIQGIEALAFGRQISYTWIREAPSVFWSGVLHFAYFAYYPIVLLGPVILEARSDRRGARQIVFTTMIAFVLCYLWFVLYPVAGPNYAFPHPTGPVRNVWSANLVYGVLEGGSSFGAAFPSSHVAATVAATGASWVAYRPLGITFVVPCLLLIVGTVYCQMHYGVDATAGVIVGLLAIVMARVWYAERLG